MGKDKQKKAKTVSGNIEEILRERDRLEQVLKENFKKEVVILFTDICGYTKYMDTHGDISGRAMLQKHNQIVMPGVEKNNGVVIKTIGDAVMASFSTPLDAVKSAVEVPSMILRIDDVVAASAPDMGPGPGGPGGMPDMDEDI